MANQLSFLFSICNFTIIKTLFFQTGTGAKMELRKTGREYGATKNDGRASDE